MMTPRETIRLLGMPLKATGTETLDDDGRTYAGYHNFHFRAELVGCFSLSGLLLDKPWSQVSSLLPPGTCLFLSRIGFSISTARRYLSNVADSRFRPFRNSISMGKKILSNGRSVRLEPMNLMFVGTRTTY